MRALVFDGSLHLDSGRAEPAPAPGEVCIRTVLAGICNTDLEIVRGYAAFSGALGHEFVGVVEAPSDPTLNGQRVVGEINVYCGGCEMCLTGRRSHCLRRTVLGIQGRDGVLAERFCLPSRNLHVIPDALTDEQAVFTEPLAAACEVLEQVHVRPTDRVIVLGDGKLGLLVAQVVALTGAELTVVGRHAAKLAILSARGIRTRLGVMDNSTADVVIDCTGRPEGFEAARQLVKPGGKLILKSTYHGGIAVNLSALVVDEVHLVGSRCGPFGAALRLMEQGLVDVLPLIAAEYPLQEALTAFEHASRPGSLKVLVRP